MRISDWSSDVCSSDLGADTVATVRIRLATTGQAKFKQLGLDRLRLYLDGESPLVHALYELLLNSVDAVSVHGVDDAAGQAPQLLGSDAVRAVGLDRMCTRLNSFLLFASLIPSSSLSHFFFFLFFLFFFFFFFFF